MRPAASPRLPGYVVLGVAAGLAALLLGRPEPAVLAAPFLLAVAGALAAARRPELAVSYRLDRDRALEGEEVELSVLVTNLGPRPVARLEVELVLPRGLSEVFGPRREASGLGAGATRTIVRRVRCRRWGGRLLGGVRLRASDHLGLLKWTREDSRALPVRVFPQPEALHRLVRPAETQAHAGNQVSRLQGEGIEFADIRAFVPGDRVRRINWRASARRGAIQVNAMHPERNADVVLFLDTFSGVQGRTGGTLDMAVRAAAALAEKHLGQRDRVGLIGFGGTLRWLQPGMGDRQLYRLVDALLDTEIVLSYAWKGLEVIPPRTLPPQSLVIALSPLLDDRVTAALLDLCGRGRDLVVVELDPAPFIDPGPRETDRLAFRLWAMEREAMRARFRALGATHLRWRHGQPLDPVLAAAAPLRRGARLAAR